MAWRPWGHARVYLEAHVEPRQPCQLLLEHLDPVDARPARPLPHELDHPLDGVLGTLEHRLDRPVPRVAHPARDAVLPSTLPGGVPEVHALDEPVRDHAPPDHGRVPAVRTQAFVGRLARASIGTTFNFYRDGDRAALCRDRLEAYLDRRADAPVLLVAEAPGYRGTRVSGVPLTSERQLTGDGPAEATATIVHRVLAERGLADDVLLWNVVPTHPHRPHDPATNRPPTRAEVAAGLRFVEPLARGRRVVAVGRLAHAALGGTYVRHPSHGGAREFAAGLDRVLA